MSDLESRLAGYTQTVARTVQPVTAAEVMERATPATLPGRFRRSAIFATAAAITIVAIGGTVLLGPAGRQAADDPAGTSFPPEPEVTLTVPTVPPSEEPEPTAPSVTSAATSLPPAAEDDTQPRGAVASAGGWTRWALDPDAFGSVTNVAVLDVIDAGDYLLAVGSTSGCAVDCGAALWVSDDGLAWRRFDLAADVRGGDGMMRAAAVGTAGVVVVGDTVDGGYAWHSEDGTEWTRSDLPDGTAAFDVVAFGSGYVATGVANHADGAVWRSLNGIDWERVPDPDRLFAGSEPYSLIVTDAGLLATGAGLSPELSEDGTPNPAFAAWSSTDGYLWTLNYVDTPSRPAFPYVGKGLSGGEAGYVAGGVMPPLWWSPDGQSWEASETPLPAFDTAWTGDGWIAILYDLVDGSLIWHSVNGTDWTPAAPAESGLFDSDGSFTGLSIESVGEGLIAFGYEHATTGPTAVLWTWNLGESQP